MKKVLSVIAICLLAQGVVAAESKTASVKNEASKAKKPEVCTTEKRGNLSVSMSYRDADVVSLIKRCDQDIQRITGLAKEAGVTAAPASTSSSLSRSQDPQELHDSHMIACSVQYTIDYDAMVKVYKKLTEAGFVSVSASADASTNCVQADDVPLVVSQ